MKSIVLLVVFSVVCVALSDAKDLIIGTRANHLVMSMEKVAYKAIPLIRRDKYYYYTDPKERIIKAIIARDLSRTAAEAEVTSGGIGYPNVTIHLMSERGVGLNYIVFIFGKYRARGWT